MGKKQEKYNNQNTKEQIAKFDDSISFPPFSGNHNAFHALIINNHYIKHTKRELYQSHDDKSKN